MAKTATPVYAPIWSPVSTPAGMNCSSLRHCQLGASLIIWCCWTPFIITPQTWTRTFAFRQTLASILEQDVETKRGNSFILVINTSFYASMLLWENSFFLLSFGGNLFKLQSKGFINAELKMRYDLWKEKKNNIPHLFSYILGSCKIFYMLLMTFLYTSLSDSTILGQYLVLIASTRNVSQGFSLLCPTPKCGRDSHSENIFFAALQGCVSASAWNGSFSWSLTVPIQRCLHILLQQRSICRLSRWSRKSQKLKKHWVSTSCPSGMDLPGHKCLCTHTAASDLQETQTVPNLRRAQLVLTRTSVHSVQAASAS